MKNLIIYRNLSKICFLFILLTINFGFAKLQINENVNQKFYKVVSFGEKIFFGELDTDVTWTIINQKKNIFINLKGNVINDYVFEHAVIYEINCSENKEYKEADCNHAIFYSKMLVKVNNVKMHFDFSKIKFADKIRTGNNCEDIIVTLPDDIILKQNRSTKFTPSQFMVAGVGSDIIVKPITQDIVPKTRTFLMQYKLFGTAIKETYVMFDFIDYNNNFQTYNQTEIVN